MRNDTGHQLQSLIQIGLQIQDGGQNGGRANAWLYLKRLYFISSGIAYCIAPYASFYAGLSCSCCQAQAGYFTST